jgi:hypothetical protein
VIEIDSSTFASPVREDGIAAGRVLKLAPGEVEDKIGDGVIDKFKFDVNPSSMSTNPPIRARCFRGIVFDGACLPTEASWLKF